jgi:serine/threonine-protein phosphatase 2A regulatory subunit B
MGLKQAMKPRKVFTAASGEKRKKDELAVDSLDFTRKILHTSWHLDNNTVAVATANNLYLFTADP